MSQPSEASVKKRPVSVIYFKESSGNTMKRLATRVRDSGVECILVWAHLFKDPSENIIHNAKAIIIEVGSPQAALIAKSYKQFANDVEIHYVESDGTFVNQDEEPDDDNRSQTHDPRTAIQGLRAESDAGDKSESSEPDPADASEGGEDSATEVEPGGDVEGGGEANAADA